MKCLKNESNRNNTNTHEILYVTKTNTSSFNEFPLKLAMWVSKWLSLVRQFYNSRQLVMRIIKIVPTSTLEVRKCILLPK